jgi:hypothetical protein
MSGRVVKEVANGAKRVSIVLAEEIQDKGFKRVLDAIDPALITATAEKVASAFSGSTLMTEAQKSQADKINKQQVSPFRKVRWDFGRLIISH